MLRGIFLGLATDLKTVPKEMLKNRVLRTGDGSHKLSKLKDAEAPVQNNNTGERDVEHFWGWGKHDSFTLGIAD